MRFENGKAVGLTRNEKVELGLKRSVAAHWPARSSWVKSFSVDGFSSTPLDKDGERIEASGECILGAKCHKNDSILMDKTYTFSIRTEDKHDEMGLPDVLVLEYKLQEI